MVQAERDEDERWDREVPQPESSEISESQVEELGIGIDECLDALVKI